MAEIRRLSKVRKVGHAGTLDPLAQGVLPICLGRATKIVPYFLEFPKTYAAVLHLGLTTDTYDAAGQVIDRQDPSKVTREEMERAMVTLTGNIWQRPPIYSAIKLRGKPLYALARAGIAVEPALRPVAIYSLEVTEWQLPLVTIRMRCSRGTYVRSLAYELGKALGCGAHVRETIRLAYGPFLLEEAVSWPRLEEALEQGQWADLVYPIDKVLEHFSALNLTEVQTKVVMAGDGLPPLHGDKPRVGERRRAYNHKGQFVALLCFQGGQWQPEKLFL